ncbi:MAG: ARMT1-like domain-containing protein [Candidatus Bathyarchaeia archaeon]
MAMKSQPECIPCMVAVRTREILSSSLSPEAKVSAQLRILDRYLELLRKDAPNVTIATELFREVKRLIGQENPYKTVKDLMNRVALQLLPSFEAKVYGFKDEIERFRAACAASIAGNIFDVGVLGHSYAKETSTEPGSIELPILTIDKTAEIRKRLLESPRVLYLCDNAGEIAFDKILVKEIQNLGAKVTVVVKGGYYQNDATMEDALAVGMDKVADELITTGTDASGLDLEEVSEEFRQRLDESQFVLLKGMAYYESHGEFKAKTGKPLATLLAAKCDPIARFLKVRKGDSVALLI